MKSVFSAETQQKQWTDELAGLLQENAQISHPDEKRDKALIGAANQLESKRKQMEAVTQIIDNALIRHEDATNAIIGAAVSAAKQHAEETRDILAVWSGEPGNLTRCPMNTELLRRVRQSQELVNISRYLDESASTIGESAAWGKAVAMTLLEIAASSKRRFALIHFAGSGSFQTDVFSPGKYSAEDKIRAAETFLNGGTDYETPLRQALALMKSDGFENADVVFLTGGECSLSEKFLTELHTEQAALRFTATGILMDKGKDCFDFSLQPFYQKIYRTSELTGDDVVRAVVSERV